MAHRWRTRERSRASVLTWTTVRHQAERGQQVIAEGACAVVRHPMYAGLLLIMSGLALWLGSTAGVMASFVPAGILALRVRFEEHLLRAALADYAAYAARVRWRMLPGFW